MSAGDEERFRLRPGAPKRSSPQGQRFVSQVLRQALRAGGKGGTAGAGGRAGAGFGRGRVAALQAGRRLGAGARRVVIKSRFVVLKKAGAHAVVTHLRYIDRDGVTRDGEKGQAYGADTDAADLKAFEARGRGDRHQFRMIVSVEDASQLEDLRGYTRELMQHMATDLETPLDWVAVDHWDTDNPHTHIVLRGTAGGGRDLVIAPDYLAHGMRARASEIATRWLGPRTELEIQASLMREVNQNRFTSLDRRLEALAPDGRLDRAAPTGRDGLLRGRLQHLERLGLARPDGPQRWALAPEMRETLTALGERGDIVRAMHRALRGEARECVLEGAAQGPVTGRIAGKGMADELNDRGYLVLDGIDGRAHYLPLPQGAQLSDWPAGTIVEARPAGQPRGVDLAITQHARGGCYRAADQVLALRREGEASPEARVQGHVRRLEALRRAGIVERLGDGVWRVPPDLVARGAAYDRERKGALMLESRSRLTLAQQAQAIGATWLDQLLVAKPVEVGARGFGLEVGRALRARAEFLVEQGFARRSGERVSFNAGMLEQLRGRELEAVARGLTTETGWQYRPAPQAGTVQGLYCRSVDLASGRFAVLRDGNGFSLVPWRPVAEQRLGQQVSVLVHGGAASWELGRGLGR